MAEQKKHQKLIELESMTDKLLAVLTNQAYGMKNKFSYKYSFIKGTQIIEAIDNGKVILTKDYYVFKFYMIDKTDSPIGVEIDLLVNYYPKKQLVSEFALKEFALNEFYLNAIRCMFNNTYADYLYKDKKAENREESQKFQEKLEDLVGAVNAKPKLFIPS